MNLITITREVRKRFPDEAKALRVSIVGSFLALRIDDPNGAITVKRFGEIALATGHLLSQGNYITGPIKPLSFGYHMNGCVANWEFNHTMPDPHDIAGGIAAEHRAGGR